MVFPVQQRMGLGEVKKATFFFQFSSKRKNWDLRSRRAPSWVILSLVGSMRSSATLTDSAVCGDSAS